MRSIQNYKADKYQDGDYQEVDKDIYLYTRMPDATFSELERADKSGPSRGLKYRYGNAWMNELEPARYVTSLVFEQEPDKGEGGSPARMSQYPLEDILEEFSASILDFYGELNAQSEKLCYQEFSCSSLEDARKLRTAIIGKQVYNPKDSGELIIEPQTT